MTNEITDPYEGDILSIEIDGDAWMAMPPQERVALAIRMLNRGCTIGWVQGRNALKLTPIKPSKPNDLHRPPP